MGTARRDALLEIQAQSQKLWEETKPYERDAPADGEGEKFMCTFPYPYMNGRLHVGHAFSLTKTEFAVRYNRLKGRNAIWPFGLHCTGMPIQAAAQRIDEEMKAFGNPPVFPVEEPAAAAGGQKSKVAAKTGGAARQWNIMQGMKLKDGEIPPFKDADHWLDYFPPLCVQDLKKMGCAIDWRRSFITTDRNPYYDAFIRWQFRVLKSQGKVKFGKRNTIYSPKDGQPCADHDRSEGEGVAPKDYCLLKLKVQKLTEKMAPLEGKNVYLCAATLRAETMPGQTNCFVKPDGEYGAYEYNETDVFIVGAHCARNMAYQGGSLEFGVPKNLLTLQGTDLIGLPLGAPRAVHETIYCLPMFNIKMDMGSGVVTSVPSDAPDDWAALRDLKEKPNLREKYGVTEEMVAFDPIPIIDIPGYGDMAAVDLVTKYKIASQNDRDKLAEAKHEVYLKGFEEGMMITGECKDKPVKFAKVKCKETMIEEGLAVPYAEPENTVISRGGDVCVVCMTDQWYLTYGEEEWREKTLKWVEQMECYASETKNQFRSVLGWLNQWACSRTFGLGTRLPWDEEWLIESLSDSTIYMAYYTISKYLQGENNLRGNEVGPSGIKPEQLDDAFFEYVFRKGPYPDNCTIPKAIMDEMRNEFEYWYPMDLRVSGKDLIGNHLTMCLYNHTAIWPDDETKWPRSIYTNGHVLVNNEKMSKSKGTFLTLVDTIEKYSADAMRLALADAGDTNEDGNFSEDTADKAVLKLTTLKEWFEGTEKSVGVFQALDKMRAGPITSFADRVFDSEMNECIMKADENFAKMQFKDALLYCFYQLTNARDFYRQACCGAMDVTKYHKDLVIRFTEVFCICMSPFTPHFCEYIYGKLQSLPEVAPKSALTAPAYVKKFQLQETIEELVNDVLRKKPADPYAAMAETLQSKSVSPPSVMDARWPTVSPGGIDHQAMSSARYLEKTLHTARLRKDQGPQAAGGGKKKKKGGGKPAGPTPKATSMTFFCNRNYPEMEQSVLKFLTAQYDESNPDCFPKDIVAKARAPDSGLGIAGDKKKMNKVMAFLQFKCTEVRTSKSTDALSLTTPFDEEKVILENLDYVKATMGIEDIKVENATGNSSAAAAAAFPGKPTMGFTWDVPSTEK